MSEDLIGRLTADLRPTSKLAVTGRLALGVGLGGILSAALTGATLGFRPDMPRAVGESMFWIKLAYVLALAAVSLWASERLTRPAGDARRRLVWLVAPMLAVGLLACWQLVRAPGQTRTLVMGGSAALCPWWILAFSLPPLAGLVWAGRGLAPTRLRLTGFVLGLAAGGAGAAAYALHCDEVGAPFLALWYTLGVAGSAAIGGLVGSRALRW